MAWSPSFRGLEEYNNAIKELMVLRVADHLVGHWVCSLTITLSNSDH